MRSGRSTKFEPILVNYDKLRYRLMPYIYSLAWRVTNEDYTIQRPLVMDWRTDPNTRDIGDEFMFGPAILVSPVLQPDATRRTLYLPILQRGTTSGREHRRREAVKLTRMLLSTAFHSMYVPVRFFPLARRLSTPSEKPAGPIELRIYEGADGTFDLYQDAGDSYDYEKGAHAVIPLRWSESTRTLTIGDREGEYSGNACEHSNQYCLGVRRARCLGRTSGQSRQDCGVHREGNFGTGTVKIKLIVSIRCDYQ